MKGKARSRGEFTDAAITRSGQESTLAKCKGGKLVLGSTKASTSYGSSARVLGVNKK